MSKKAIYYEEAKRLYVNNGIALDTIESMLENKVTRRTLHNWKSDGKWDDKRKRYLSEQEDLSDMVMAIAKTCAQNAAADPNPKNMLALLRAITALKEKDALALLTKTDSEKGTEGNESLVQTIMEAVKQELGA